VFCRVPRFTYENFPAADRRLSTSMKSVGEAIGVGRDLGEALQKALRARDERRGGLGFDEGEAELAALSTERLRDALREPTAARLLHVRHALDRGISEDEVQGLTGIDRRFLVAIRKIGERAAALRSVEGRDALAAIDPDLLRAAKREGFADAQIAYLTRTGERFVRETRARLGIRPAPRALAADGRARDLAYDDAECAAPPAGRSVVVLGGGPARIGQGPELATVCAGVAGAVRAAGVRCVVVDPNPASVAPDAPYADAVYVVPLTVEDVLEVVRAEHPEGVIVQVGGPTARRLAAELAAEGVPILGTAPDAIDRAEDHDRMGRLVRSLGLRRPDDGTADDLEGARAAAARIGYPVVARLAYAQGGRAMAIVFSEADLETFLRKTLPAKDAGPVLLDRFLDYATEVDVDAVADGRDVRVVGILEHIEEAGVHSGDSACVLPPHTLAPRIIDEVARQTRAIALGLAVKGFLNVQFAIKGNDVHVLGITPRASLTAPLVARATGVPLAALAARVLLGESLVDLPAPPAGTLPYVACKEVALPFVRFPGVDPVLGPEMRSTGEVMGIDAAYGSAFLKSQLAAGQRLPTSGTVFFSLKDADKRALIPLAQRFVAMGFAVIATRGTADVFGRNGIPCQVVRKVSEGRPNIVDRVINREVALLINTPSGRAESVDEASIRKRAYSYGVPLVTTVSGAFAVADGIEALRTRGVSVRPLQEYHAAARRP
jgi:carbamoyl-phosphate synthase large subunit